MNRMPGFLRQQGIPAPADLARFARGVADDTAQHGTGDFSWWYPKSFGEAAMWLAPFPGVGDAAGLLADAEMYWQEPESRTLPNFLMTGAGLAPAVPAPALLRSASKAVGGAVKRANYAAPSSVQEAKGLLDKAGLSYDEQVARTGTTYLSVQDGKGGVFDVRVSDHPNVAGAFSHDGRTQNYTDPDIDIVNNGYTDLGSGIKSLAERLGLETPESYSSRIAKKDAKLKAQSAQRIKEKQANRAQWDQESLIYEQEIDRFGLREKFDRARQKTGKARHSALRKAKLALQKARSETGDI